MPSYTSGFSASPASTYADRKTSTTSLISHSSLSSSTSASSTDSVSLSKALLQTPKTYPTSSTHPTSTTTTASKSGPRLSSLFTRQPLTAEEAEAKSANKARRAAERKQLHDELVGVQTGVVGGVGTGGCMMTGGLR